MAEETPKKTTRKPDPTTQLLNELKAELKALSDWTVNELPPRKAEHYDGRAHAWSRHYASNGQVDGLLLSLAFEALSSLNPSERRYSLVQLAAASLTAIEKLDGGK
ncbi:hypothetical protein ACGFYA_20410 [Streptomyces sp. NPDC048305]|uniref:hypothetical protein n=1 Tax=Streptomyces sp. NPDC048305 TaxID=3365532 RepID=UPI00371D867A